MYLCFGTFCKVLTLFRKDRQRKNAVLTESDFIATLMSYVFPNHSCISTGTDQKYYGIDKETKSINNNFTKNKNVKGVKEATSKLLNCHIKVTLLESAPQTDDVLSSLINKIAHNIANEIIPLLEIDNIWKIALAIIYLIKADNTLMDSNKYNFEFIYKKNFEDFFKQENLQVSTFLSQTLIFTIYYTDNTKGKDSVKEINYDYINKLTMLYTNEIILENINNTFYIKLLYQTYITLFHKILCDTKIHTFLNNVDPSVSLNNSWLEQFEEFMLQLDKKIIEPYYPVNEDLLGYSLKTILSFNKLFDEYTTFLGLNMHPVLSYRDNNNKCEFIDDFLNQLNQFYENISTDIKSENLKRPEIPENMDIGEYADSLRPSEKDQMIEECKPLNESKHFESDNASENSSNMFLNINCNYQTVERIKDYRKQLLQYINDLTAHIFFNF